MATVLLPYSSTAYFLFSFQTMQKGTRRTVQLRTLSLLSQNDRETNET